MRLGIISLLLIAASLLISISAGLDVLYIIKTKKERKRLSTYLEYEKLNISRNKEFITDRIKTSISFGSEKKRSNYHTFMTIDDKCLQDVERDILTLYPGANSLDSLPFMNDDIANARKIMLVAKDIEIKSFYEHLLFLPVLETLASKVYYDSGSGFSHWVLYRPITEDSTYIGAWLYGDGDSKHAFRINGQHYESNGQYYGNSYSDTYLLPKRDTLNIETIYMVNQGTSIDTSIKEQTIVFNKGRWKNIMNR